MLKKSLLQLLNSAKGEMAAAAFLKKNPNVVRWAFSGKGGHSTFVLADFPFGARFRADFVVILSYSGAWEVHFVELEPVSDIVITKDGKASKRFNGAISQIGDWREFIERNPGLVRKDLSDWCRKKDLLGESDGSRPINFSGNLLGDPETFIDFGFHVVIGRRGRVMGEKRRKMNQYRHGFFHVCTYDTFVDIAGNLEKASSKNVQRVDLTETHDFPSGLAGKLRIQLE